MSADDAYAFVVEGRELANKLLETQTLKSTQETLRNNMAVLQVAATHVLASLIFHQLRSAPDEAVGEHLGKIIWGIKNELKYMEDARAAGAFTTRPVSTKRGEAN